MKYTMVSPLFINTNLPSDTKQYSLYEVDQNELQVKMKFLCLLTLVICESRGREDKGN